MREPDYLSRRSVLAGFGAALPAAATAAPISAHGDAELLELGRKLDAAIARAQAFRPAYDAADASRGEKFETHRAEFELAAEIDRKAGDRSFSAWKATFDRFCSEEEKVICQGNALMEAANRLSEDILNRPARTIAALGVHARALAWGFDSAWDGPLDEADYEAWAVRRFVENLCALAGVSPLPNMEAA